MAPLAARPGRGGMGGGGNHLDAGDLIAPEPAKAKRDQAIEVLPEAARPKRKAEDDPAPAGHARRRGKDVAGLDVAAVVAAHLLWLTSKGAQGKRADFHGMDLAGGDLGGAVLANATFREVDLSDANLAQARLDGADFRRAVLGAADLTGANLGVAQLRHADLRLAKLEGASLRGADLAGARLQGAILAGADFTGAILMGADLAGVDLSQAENLTQGQIDKAECDMETKLPPGLFPARKDDA